MENEKKPLNETEVSILRSYRKDLLEFVRNDAVHDGVRKAIGEAITALNQVLFVQYMITEVDND